MLNNRTFILFIAFVAIFVLTVGWVTTRTEVVSNPSRDSASVLENQEGFADQNKAPIPSYRSPLDECFDVSLREAANCHSASQVTVPSYRSPLDECFDVSLREVASCRKADQEPIPS